MCNGEGDDSDNLNERSEFFILIALFRFGVVDEGENHSSKRFLKYLVGCYVHGKEGLNGFIIFGSIAT